MFDVGYDTLVTEEAMTRKTAMTAKAKSATGATSQTAKTTKATAPKEKAKKPIPPKDSVNSPEAVSRQKCRYQVSGLSKKKCCRRKCIGEENRRVRHDSDSLSDHKNQRHLIVGMER